MIGSSNTKNIDTQLVFLNCLDGELVDEFLQRIKHGDTEHDILTFINNDTTFVKPESLIVFANIGSMKTNTAPSLYFSFHEMGEKICHISIHLCPNSNNTTKPGPVHLTNNITNRKNTRKLIQRIYIKKTENGSLLFSLGSLFQKNSLSPKAIHYSKYIIDMLNAYFDKQSTLYLGKRKYKKPHVWKQTILTKKQNAFNKLSKNKKSRKTRKLRKSE